MARYFCIMSGLRGCYMPDSVWHIKCETRRELKEALEYEARFQISDAGFRGHDKKVIAWAAAKAWREYGQRRFGQYATIPYGPGTERTFAIDISASCRSDYLEYQESH